ncbi:MAG: low temperature requirement protein A, partial [Chloroflexota bacterium]
MSDLFIRPRYFRDVIFHRHTDRAIGWLELFYDLVYVATLIQIGNFLSDNLTLLGFGQFIVMMFVVWWAWTGETLYQNRFVADDWLHRLLIFIQIAGVAVIGLSVSEAFGDLSVQFTVGYVMVRSIMIVLYIRTYVTHPESQAQSVNYMIGFGGGIAIWLGALFIPAAYHWVAWLVAIAFEIVFFARSSLRPGPNPWSIDVHHGVERFGIFTIIVLGEAFVKVLDDAQGTALALPQILFGIAGLVVLYAMWWLYFSDTADDTFDEVSANKTISWGYGHLLLAVGLVSFGVAVKKLFSSTISYAGEPVTEEYRLLFTVAIALFLVALALIDYGINDDLTAKSQKVAALVHVVSAVAVVIAGLVFTGVTATGFVTIMTAIMVT